MRITEGVIISLTGLGAAWGAWQIPEAYAGEVWAGLVPMTVAAGLCLGGVLMIAGGLKVSSQPVDKPVAGGRFPAKVLFLIALAFVYQAAIGAFGYLLPTALVAPLVLLAFGVRSKPGLLLAAVLCPLLFHLIFFELLGVFPPYGSVFEPLDLIGG